LVYSNEYLLKDIAAFRYCLAYFFQDYHYKKGPNKQILLDIQNAANRVQINALFASTFSIDMYPQSGLAAFYIYRNNSYF